MPLTKLARRHFRSLQNAIINKFRYVIWATAGKQIYYYCRVKHYVIPEFYCKDLNEELTN
jgi:hypothetical protein